MSEIFRTPEERFSVWKGYPFSPHYIEWEGLRMHYVDEGEPTAPVMLLLHGMPTSSYLYRRMIPGLVEAGYRCIAPDYIGFGKSDKVLDDGWYSIEKHSQSCGHLITALDLRNVTLICQDWGGPIGLRQATDQPERFERLTIMNTWLHHPEHEYSPALREWNSLWHDGGAMEKIQGCGFVMQHQATRVSAGDTPLSAEELFEAYEAPFPDRASKAGPRRFPLSLPFDNPEGGNAEVQRRCFEDLLAWSKPIHFIWGVLDDVFLEEWGRKWASFYAQATFDTVDSGHFLQEFRGPEVVSLLLGRIGEE